MRFSKALVAGMIVAVFGAAACTGGNEAVPLAAIPLFGHDADAVEAPGSAPELSPSVTDSESSIEENDGAAPNVNALFSDETAKNGVKQSAEPVASPWADGVVTGGVAPVTGSLASAIEPQDVDEALSGYVVVWEDGELRRISGAHIGTGDATFRTDADGYFSIPADERTSEINVVAPGYEVIRSSATANSMTFFLQPLDVRAIYLPYERLWQPATLAWALDLARAGTISAVVIDVKEEGGAVLPLVATDTVREIGAIVDPGTDIEGFLRELEELGIYRIARVPTFLDRRFAFAFPSEAIQTRGGGVMVDTTGLAWTNPFSAAARRYNVEIAVEAAEYFEEIQFDYVRLPGNSRLALFENTTGEERSAAIVRFAQEAGDALHAVGAAISFDTFGETTILRVEDTIGQVLEDLAPYLDYVSPMVYPSTWRPGWFGLAYPPADPYAVVYLSISTAVSRLEADYNVLVRPWLQDFSDYQEQKLPYGANEVLAQIRANRAGGGAGFMLWDPSLNYQTDILDQLAIGTTDGGFAPPIPPH